MIKGLVSIIVPIYCVEEYLDTCLQSISEQTYAQLQVLLVNDGSPDQCPEICARWAAKDPRFQVIHQENRGVSTARNKAMPLIQGEYLLFADADDWLEPDMIGKMVEKFRENSQVDAVFCGYKEVEDRSGAVLKTVAPEAKGAVDRDEGVAEIFGQYSTMLWNKLFRTAMLPERAEFAPDIKIGEDELWMIQNLKNAGGIYLMEDPLYCYRNRSAGASKDFSLSPARLTEIDSQKRVLEEISDYGSETLVLLAQKRMYFTCQVIMKRAFYQGDVALFTKIDREIAQVRKVWFAHHRNFLGKCRRKLVEAMMRRRFPSRLVRLLDK